LKEDVEDLAQDIFLELYQKNDLNESHLWKLAKSRLYNFIRDRARRKHQEKEFIEFLKEFFKRINKDE
jgi:DNA-directed RNA polymerase specialized sigma24 family protein